MAGGDVDFDCYDTTGCLVLRAVGTGAGGRGPGGGGGGGGGGLRGGGGVEGGGERKRWSVGEAAALCRDNASTSVGVSDAATLYPSLIRRRDNGEVPGWAHHVRGVMGGGGRGGGGRDGWRGEGAREIARSDTHDAEKPHTEKTTFGKNHPPAE